MQYGISTECTHFYCGPCIREYLETCLQEGRAPAFCPGCQDNVEPGAVPEGGRIEGKALSFLEEHGVVDRLLMFRFLKLQHEAAEAAFFECPAKCGNLLLDVEPSLVLVKDTLRVQVERCPCGRGVCVSCHQLVPDDKMVSHTCPKGKAPDMASQMATLALMRSIGKKCPKCSMFVIKNGGELGRTSHTLQLPMDCRPRRGRVCDRRWRSREVPVPCPPIPGCDFMMCGTVAHGKLRDAIRNGGCGYSFSWNSGKAISTFFINVEGKKVTGNPATMYPQQIKKLRKEYGIGADLMQARDM